MCCSHISRRPNINPILPHCTCSVGTGALQAKLAVPVQGASLQHLNILAEETVELGARDIFVCFWITNFRFALSIGHKGCSCPPCRELHPLCWHSCACELCCPQSPSWFFLVGPPVLVTASAVSQKFFLIDLSCFFFFLNPPKCDRGRKICVSLKPAWSL